MLVLLLSKGHTDTPLVQSVYICLSVCATTKSFHLKLSLDLTTEMFLLAFPHFTALRGPVHKIHSDNGTNFVGASRLLTSLDTFIQSSLFQGRVSTLIVSENGNTVALQSTLFTTLRWVVGVWRKICKVTDPPVNWHTQINQ